MKILEIIKEAYLSIGLAIEKMKLGTREKEFEKKILAANKLLLEKKLSEAKDAFTELNKQIPESEYIAKRLEDIDKLESAKADRKAEFDLTIEESVNHLKSGNVQEGEDMLNDAMKLSETHDHALILQAKGLLSDLQNKTKIENDCSDLMNEAKKSEKKKDYQAAVDAYDKILKTIPGDENAMSGLAAANQKLPLMDSRGKKKREVLLSELRCDALSLKEKIDIYRMQQYKKKKSVTRFVQMGKSLSAWLRNGLVE